ncbi:hypothetical protein [Nannocystis pusilla]|uniref:hypothetical protein n=1 Tax=Nannocystis pusilla TaxID=889268 RepID=UPI003DA26DD2
MTLTQVQLVQMQRQVESFLVNKHNKDGSPYILGVGFGLEEINNVLTSPPKIAFRVYFDSREASQNKGGPISAPPFLTPSDPPICTVNVAQWTGESEPNTDFVPGPYRSELVSGLDIHSGSGYMDRGLGSGTLGFFATLNSEQDKLKNVVLVTNYHVVIKAPSVAPEREFKEDDYVWRSTKSIAKIVNVTRPNGKKVPGWKDFHLYSYQDYSGDTPRPYYVDCAAAWLIREKTSCCKAICPDTWTEFKNVVQHLETELPGRNITNVARLTHLDLLQSVQAAQAPEYKILTVFKSGRTTGLTWGRVIDVMAPYPKKGLIIIESTKKDGSNNLMNFADHGDSGSALLNSQRELVGLVYAIEGSNQTRAYACHIHPVLNCLERHGRDQRQPHPRQRGSGGDVVRGR